MFGTSKVSPNLPPGSPLTIRSKDAANPGQWSAASGDVDVGDVVEAQRRHIVFMLLKGKIYGLPGSQGTRWSNFREWAKNQHPVLSMFLAHELHPFSRTERLSVMMCYLCWAFFITVVFEYGNKDEVAICNAGCNNTYSGGVSGEYRSEQICGRGSGSNEDAISAEEYDSNCDGVTPWWVLSFLIAAATVPYSTILKFLATCSCAQSLPNCLKSCFECLGALILRLFGVLSVLWLAMGIIFSLELDGGMFIVTYIAGVIKSWFYWPILAGAVFMYKYKKQRAAFQEAHPGQVAMAWPIDEQDPNLDLKVAKDGTITAYKSPPGSPKAAAAAAPNCQSPPGQNGAATPVVSPIPQQGQFFGGGGGAGGPQAMVVQHMSSPMSPTSTNNSNGTPNNGYGGGAPPLQQPGYAAPTYAAHMAGGPTLPPGWEMKMEPDGRMLYIDHNTKARASCGAYRSCEKAERMRTTHLTHPSMQQQQQQQMGPPAGGAGYPGPPALGFVPPAYGGQPAHHQPYQQQQQQPVSGYHAPQQQPMRGYHDQQQPQQQLGYPPAGGYPGHTQQQPPPGYPVQQPNGGYPGQQQQQHQQMMSPPVMQHQQAPVVMEFKVPDGVVAGDTINSPKGIIEVKIPDGSSSGDTLHIPLQA
ncbi:unnamed protein product [Ectocarpus sp. 4 AP-2014]